MKRLILILIFSPLLMQAQWDVTDIIGANTYNNPKSLIKTIDDGFIIGRVKDVVYSEGPMDFYGCDTHILKYDSLGNQVWQETITGYKMSYSFCCITNLGDSNFAIIYYRSDLEEFIPLPSYSILEIYDFNNTIVETKNLGNKIYYNISLCSDSGFVLIGESILKLDKYYNNEWTITQSVNGVVSKENNLYFISRKNSGTQISKYTTEGDSIWTKYYKFSNKDYFKDVILLKDGNILITGQTNYVPFYESDILVFKIDTSGSVLWNKQITSPKHTTPIAIAEHQNKELFIVGTKKITKALNSEKLIFTKRLDSLSNEISHKTIDTYYKNISVSDLEITNDRGIIILSDNRANSSRLTKISSSDSILFPIIDPNLDITNKKLINIIDFSGRETKQEPNIPLIYIYDNGTAEKKMIIE